MVAVRGALCNAELQFATRRQKACFPIPSRSGHDCGVGCLGSWFGAIRLAEVERACTVSRVVASRRWHSNSDDRCHARPGDGVHDITPGTRLRPVQAAVSLPAASLGCGYRFHSRLAPGLRRSTHPRVVVTEQAKSLRNSGRPNPLSAKDAVGRGHRRGRSSSDWSRAAAAKVNCVYRSGDRRVADCGPSFYDLPGAEVGARR
jgi:hypothetical protein